MEDFWKSNKTKQQLNTFVEHAEHKRLVKGFRDEEQAAHRRNLLFMQPPVKKKDSNR